jgi:hypothetical protein
MLQKTDKACGKSFIAEGQKCSKTPISRPNLATNAATNANLTRHLLTAGGLAVAGGMLAGVYDFQEDIKGSALPPEAVCPKEPPAGLYDSFKPGDLIYTTFEMAGGTVPIIRSIWAKKTASTWSSMPLPTMKAVKT